MYFYFQNFMDSVLRVIIQNSKFHQHPLNRGTVKRTQLILSIFIFVYLPEFQLLSSLPQLIHVFDSGHRCNRFVIPFLLLLLSLRHNACNTFHLKSCSQAKFIQRTIVHHIIIFEVNSSIKLIHLLCLLPKWSTTVSDYEKKGF